MNQENKPKYLYRGVVFDYSQLENFAFSGDLSVPYEPFINAKGQKTSHDGNEYGMYMTDNIKMVEAAYGNPNHRDGTPINKKIRIGYGNQCICVPHIGVTYKINTEHLDIRRPWISQALEGHYNNGFEGDEWIADRIPEGCYQIIRVKIGRDFLHGAEDLEINDISNIKEEIKNIMEQRKSRLQLFAKAIEKLSIGKRRLIDPYTSYMNMFQDIFGENGVHYMDEGSIDTSSASGMLKYLLAGAYHKDTENIDFNTLLYIEDLKQKLTSSNEPENIETLSSIIRTDLAEVIQGKQKFIENNPGNSLGFDKKIAMISAVFDNLEQAQRSPENKRREFAKGLKVELPSGDVENIINQESTQKDREEREI